MTLGPCPCCGGAQYTGANVWHMVGCMDAWEGGDCPALDIAAGLEAFATSLARFDHHVRVRELVKVIDIELTDCREKDWPGAAFRALEELERIALGAKD